MGLGRWWRRDARERQRAEEMRAHIDLYIEELIARGRTRAPTPSAKRASRSGTRA